MDDYFDPQPRDCADVNVARERAMKRALTILEEHFECALVLVSSNVGSKDTGSAFDGFGNFYARVGMAQWYLRNEYGRMPPDV